MIATVCTQSDNKNTHVIAHTVSRYKSNVTRLYIGIYTTQAR